MQCYKQSKEGITRSFYQSRFAERSTWNEIFFLIGYLEWKFGRPIIEEEVFQSSPCISTLLTCCIPDIILNSKHKSKRSLKKENINLVKKNKPKQKETKKRKERKKWQNRGEAVEEEGMWRVCYRSLDIYKIKIKIYWPGQRNWSGFSLEHFKFKKVIASLWNDTQFWLQ